MGNFLCDDGEKIKTKYVIGDVVKIKTFGQTYPNYVDAFYAMNIDNKFLKKSLYNNGVSLITFTDEEMELYKNDNYIIIDLCVHHRNYVIYLIKHIRTNTFFVIDDYGIKLNENIPKNVTRFLRKKNENKVLIKLR